MLFNKNKQHKQKFKFYRWKIAYLTIIGDGELHNHNLQKLKNQIPVRMEQYEIKNESNTIDNREKKSYHKLEDLQ